MATETAMSVMEAIRRRRAVRSYRPDTLDEATVRRLLDAAVQAPTAMHLEPWAFVVVQDRALLRRYSDMAKELLAAQSLPAPGNGAAHHVRSLIEDPGFNIFYDASTLIAIAARPLSPFVVADCWLAAENLLLAATALGLGTCCIGFAVGVLNLPEVKAELSIPPDVTVVAPLIVGVPAVVPPPVPRKEPEILSWRRPGA